MPSEVGAKGGSGSTTTYIRWIHKLHHHYFKYGILSEVTVSVTMETLK